MTLLLLPEHVRALLAGAGEAGLCPAGAEAGPWVGARCDPLLRIAPLRMGKGRA